MSPPVGIRGNAAAIPDRLRPAAGAGCFRTGQDISARPHGNARLHLIQVKAAPRGRFRLVPATGETELRPMTMPAPKVSALALPAPPTLATLAAGALALSACAVTPPTGPSFAAMPGQGKTLAQFRTDDLRCRQMAFATIGYVPPGQAGAQSAAASAAVGTGLGAAAGALIGAAAGSPGVGAAVGAGTGLVAGGAIGAGTAQASTWGLQRSYDIAYAQCMTAAGEKVPDVNTLPQYMPYYYPAYAYPPYYGSYYGPYGWGGGWGGWGGGWGW